MQQLEEAEDRYADEAARLAIDMKELMDTSGGRYLMWQLLQLTGFFNPPPVVSSEAVLFNEGKRTIGAHIYDLIFTYAPDKFTLIRSEGQERDAILSAPVEQEENY